MLKFRFLLFLVLFSKFLYAQDANDKIVYLDSLGKEVSEGSHKFYRIVKGYYDTKQEYRFEEYYKSGKLKMEGNSEGKDVLIKRGLFINYYENGNKKEIVYYEKGRPNGLISEWYEDGNQRMEGQYIQNQDDLFPELKINQYWDANKNQKVIDGNGEYGEIDLKNMASGKIKNGSKDGEWKGINYPLKYSYTEFYENGKLSRGVSTDSLNVEHEYKEVFLAPKPQKGLIHFYEYIAKKFKIPRSAEGISGKIILQFIIKKDGSIDEIKVVQSLGYGLDEEAIRVVSKYPDWGIGEFRGIKISTSFSIPIVIKAVE